MIRIVGAACVFSACACVGFGRSRQLYKREEYLLDIRSFLDTLDIQISFSSDKLKHCFEGFESHTQLGELLSYVCDHMDSDGLRLSWENGVRLHTRYLTDGDRQMLLSLGSRLGKTDRENQCRHIRCMRALADKQYEEARGQRERMARLCAYGGMLVGLFAVLVLI